jgi:hypothetical protein
MMNTLFLCAFYCPVIPAVMIYSIVSLLACYFIDKWVLLRRRRVSSALGAALSYEMIDLLEWFLPLFCISNIIFDYLIIPDTDYEEYKNTVFSYHSIVHIIQNASSYAIAGLLIGIIHSILPTHTLNEELFSLDDITLSMPYL